MEYIGNIMTNFDASLVYSGKGEKERPAGLCFPVDLWFVALLTFLTLF